MAILKTANTSLLAQRIHEASIDIIDEVEWVAKKVWYTAGELRRDGESYYGSNVSSVSARVYGTSGSDGGVHQYTFFGANLDQPFSASASSGPSG